MWNDTFAKHLIVYFLKGTFLMTAVLIDVAFIMDMRDSLTLDLASDM